MFGSVPSLDRGASCVFIFSLWQTLIELVLMLVQKHLSSAKMCDFLSPECREPAQQLGASDEAFI